MLRLGCIERKEKGNTGGIGGPEGYCPFWILCRDRERKLCRERVSLALCYDKVFCVATRFSSQAYDPSWACTTNMRVRLGHACDRHAHMVGTRVRQSFLALCLDKDIHVAIGFQGMLGGLGRDRGFLYRDIDFWPHVTIEVLCHNRVWGWEWVLGS